MTKPQFLEVKKNAKTKGRGHMTYVLYSGQVTQNGGNCQIAHTFSWKKDGSF